MSDRRKITVVGAGNVGATCAQVLALRDYADVVLVDIKEGLPQGKALDINQMGAVLGYEPYVVGANDYEESAGSEVVVITAGLPRSPGMSRDDLVTTNEKIVGSVTEQVVSASPDAILIVVSNPLDAMCHVAKSSSSWPKERVFGMAGILDTARFSTFIAWETRSSVKDVTAMVLGGHGDQMVPVVSATTVGGVPLTKLVPDDRIAAIGFGLPSPIDQRTGRVVGSVHVPLADFDFRDHVAERFSVPVALDNDAHHRSLARKVTAEQQLAHRSRRCVRGARR